MFLLAVSWFGVVRVGEKNMLKPYDYYYSLYLVPKC